MGAPRPDLGQPATCEARHRAAGRADDPAVDRPDARRPSHHLQRPKDGAPPADDRDVRARAAALDDDAVGDPELVERGGHARRRPGPDRQRRAVQERLDAHRTAVAAQDEERDVEPRFVERPADERRRRSTTGRMLALIAALTVRVSRP